MTLTVSFGLPNVENEPFVGPFESEVVIGDRNTSNISRGEGHVFEYPANRPVECEELQEFEGEEAPNGSLQTGCEDDAKPVNVSTRDLALQHGTAATVTAGQTASLAYSAIFAGKAEGVSFNLSANTNAAGATAPPVNSVLEPSEPQGEETTSNTTEKANVAVPSSLAAGEYTVTLTATVEGQVRSAVDTLHVLAASKKEEPVVNKPSQPIAPIAPIAPKPLPPITATLHDLHRLSAHDLFVHGLPVRFHCSGACTAKIDLLFYETKSYKKAASISRWKVVPTILVDRRYVSLGKAGDGHTVLVIPRSDERAFSHLNKFTAIVRMVAVNSEGKDPTPGQVKKVHLDGVCAHGPRPCVIPFVGVVR